MPEGPGFLEFFILEASDYVEQLDGLLLAGGTRGGAPDADALQRVARALRGTATMAKLTSFADLAGSVERVGRALHERHLQWDPALGGVLIAAIDDLKTLLHAARNWSPTDDRRAITRSAELSRYAPSRPAAASVEGTPAASAFLATEAANIAAGLELLTTRAGDADTAANVLKRIRALRGVAGVKEVAPLADALEATEDTGRVLESGRELSAEARRLLESAAAYLRTLAVALRSGGDVNAATPARETFETARDSLTARDAERERVVPIAELFYADGSGVLEAAQHPPTTVAERFRLELVSLGEHLRQVVDAARGSRDATSKARIQRELRRALGALEAACESFGEQEIADFIRAHGQAANNIDFLGLSALDDLASLLAKPGAEAERLRTRLREITGSRDMATAIGAGFGHETPRSTPPVSATPAASAPAARPTTPPAVTRVPTPPVARAATPPRPATPPAPQPPAAARPVETQRPETPVSAPIAAEPKQAAASARSAEKLDSTAASLIDSSIAALESFSTRSLLPQTPLDEEVPVVPIESLLYRGRAALDRAVEVRDRIRQFGAESDPDALEELMDLVELARAE